VEVCKERNISEVTFHRWKKQFGQMDLNEAKRLKELERGRGQMGSGPNYLNFTSFALPIIYSGKSGRTPFGSCVLRFFALKI
jgi:hypothetical protein